MLEIKKCAIVLTLCLPLALTPSPALADEHFYEYDCEEIVKHFLENIDLIDGDEIFDEVDDDFSDYFSEACTSTFESVERIITLLNETPDLVECENSNGDVTFWTYRDSRVGSVYEIWVLEEVSGSDFRVGYDNQHTESYKSTSIIVTELESGDPYFSQPHQEFVGERQITGTCGVLFQTSATNSDTAKVDVEVLFSGLTESKTQASGETLTTEVWSENTEEWEVSAEVSTSGAGGSTSYGESMGYGDSESTSWSEESSVTWTSTKVSWGQDYTVDGPGKICIGGPGYKECISEIVV